MENKPQEKVPYDQLVLEQGVRKLLKIGHREWEIVQDMFRSTLDEISQKIDDHRNPNLSPEQQTKKDHIVEQMNMRVNGVFSVDLDPDKDFMGSATHDYLGGPGCRCEECSPKTFDPEYL